MTYSELKEAVTSADFTQTYHVSDAITAITEAFVDGHITEEQNDELIALINNHLDIRQIIEGDFTEGSKVTVNIDGNIITRVVKWDNNAKDLYIMFKNNKYFYCEFY